MTKYHYSIVRFVPSPVRGEFVNLGIIVGCDEKGEWLIDIASSRSRATKIDDQNVFPMVAADLQRLQSDIEGYADSEVLVPNRDVSLEWLSQMARDSQNLLQFSTPRPILAESADSAMAQLWPLLVVEPTKTEHAKVTKSSVLSQYWSALARSLPPEKLKKKVDLTTSKTHTSVDVVAHNGVVKDITQCWSLQVKDPQRIMEDIKSWGWTMKTLREHGGVIRTRDTRLEVPANVNLGVVYAPSDDVAVCEEAKEVFQDGELAATVHTLEEVDDYASSVASLLAAE